MGSTNTYGNNVYTGGTGGQSSNSVRTEYETLVKTQEMLRQSTRIKEQLECLNKILDTVTGDLSDMNTMMGKYSPELVKQIKSLHDYLVDYKKKAGDIYNDVSDSLALYANNLIQNLENLTTRITEIGNLVNNL